MSDKDKAKYSKQFKSSKHVPKVKGARKAKRSKVHDNRETRKETGKRRKAKRDTVDQQRLTMNVEGAGVINKEGVKALALVNTHHLNQAALGIEDKRQEIGTMVRQSFADKPELYSEGLASVREMMHGGLLDNEEDAIEGEFEEVDNDDIQAVDDAGTPIADEEGKPVSRKQQKEAPQEEEEDDEEEEEPRRSRKRPHKDPRKQREGSTVLRGIIKYGLLAAGIGLIAVAAGPLSVVIGRGLLELWSEMPALASSEQEELDDDTVNEVLTHTITYLRNMDMEDLHSQSKEAFAALASNVDIYKITMDAVLPLTGERPRGRVGKNFFGGSFSNMDTLANAIERALTKAGVLHEHEHSVSDVDDCHLFFCTDANRTLVALGMNETLGIYHVALLKW